MTSSANLNLPHLLASQADKHVTYNDAIDRLDSLVQMQLKTTTSSSPPSTAPADGEAWFVGPNPSSLWAGQAGKIAIWHLGNWRFETPKRGWIAWVQDLAAIYSFDGQEWQPMGRSVPMLGVNTVGDPTNKLAVKSDAILLSHDEAGSGDVRITVNKSASNKIASLLFQTAWSGRAELSVGNDDALTIRTSHDGTHWIDALKIDPQTGRVALTLAQQSAQMINLLPDAGRFAGSPEPVGASASAFAPPVYWSPYNNASFAQGPKYSYDSSSYDGPNPALDTKIVALIDKVRNTAQDRTLGRFGVEFFTLQVTAGTQTSYPIVNQGVTHYLTMTNLQTALPEFLTIRTHILVVSGSVFLANGGAKCELFIDGTLQPSGQVGLVPADGWKQASRIWHHPTYTSHGYEPTLWKLWASPGAVFLLALPAVVSGRAQPLPNVVDGLLPGQAAWR